MHGHHVRVAYDLAVIAHGCHLMDESNEAVARERAQSPAAGAPRDYQVTARAYLQVRKGEDLSLQLYASIKLRYGRALPYLYDLER